MTDEVTKSLSGVLNIETTLPPHKQKKEIVMKEVKDLNADEEQKRQVDFDIARTNIKTLIVKGEEVLDGIIDLATSGEHPRAYEVAGQLIKTLVDANKDLMGLHKKKEVAKDKEEPAPVVNNNTVHFNGTTNDLLKQILDRRNNNADV